MRANSSPVVSRQAEMHPQLDAVVRRHLATRWQRPPSARGVANFGAIRDWLTAQEGRPLILDSGCGTGASTRLLASMNAAARVLGADRSGVRLQKSGLGDADVHIDGSLCLARINLEDLWPLLVDAGVRLQRHVILYPNPAPKPELLKRRWHAHPALPTLLALGGELELRSNWRIYIDEFARALELAGYASCIEAIDPAEPPLSPFEHKYRESGQVLWRVLCAL